MTPAFPIFLSTTVSIHFAGSYSADASGAYASLSKVNPEGRICKPSAEQLRWRALSFLRFIWRGVLIDGCRAPLKGNTYACPSSTFSCFFVLAEQGWKSGQVITWRRGEKTVAAISAAVGVCRLLGFDPREEDCYWLETLRNGLEPKSAMQMPYGQPVELISPKSNPKATKTCEMFTERK